MCALRGRIRALAGDLRAFGKIRVFSDELRAPRVRIRALAGDLRALKKIRAFAGEIRAPLEMRAFNEGLRTTRKK
ncbi:hypothetical protein NCCP2716_08440 [Sporosarcina sp. NCCP-2716]|nr:hypothetical protein NCCP2716_08440 [Sporosarcina sp. NCCP-2716]